MSKSYDLSTSTKWANLADGDHVVKLRARGSGYGSSSFSNSVTVKKGSAMPVKGDLITIESKQYRVLKTNGSVAEVLAMYDASKQKFDLNSSYNNIYAGKNIDTYCNNTFYSGLSSAMKTAIVDKTFTQDSWNRGNFVPSSSHYTGKDIDGDLYYLVLDNAVYGESITRHCYCLSVQDILDYLECTTSMGTSDTTLTGTNVLQMFLNVTAPQSRNFIWLRSASSGNSANVLYVSGVYGYLDNNYVGNTLSVRPAFQIDLSKIEWTPVGGVTEHTLTSNTIAPHNIKVNGSALSTVPYTLNSGDAIVINVPGMEDSAISLNGVTKSNNDTVTVKDTDIIVELVNGSYYDPILTINYTA